MRILPVNNYNYQSKIQNKQQNVKFGMYKAKANAVDAKRLCEAGFIRVGEILHGFLANLGKKVKTPSGETSVGRQFKREELQKLRTLADQAEKENTVMSLAEHRDFEMILSSIPESLDHKSEFTNESLIIVIEALIDEANPVINKTRAYLTH